MTDWKIPLYRVFTDKDDLKSISNVLKRGMDWAIGPEIIQFEKSLAEYVGSKFCLSFNSGTSALHASLLAAKINKGNEIITPSFTFIATPNSALMVNAIPKFVDIDMDTLGLDPECVKQNITTKTKAIIPVHYAGLPCKIEEISKIAQKKKIYLIEDAAESLGSHVNKKMTGTFGDIGIFSFAGNKVLTSGEGGAIVTNSKQLFEKLKLIRSHGRKEILAYFSSTSSPDYVSLGYNWRMSSITAALALSQLNKLNKLIKLRRKNAEYLSSNLKKFPEIRVPPEPKGYYHVYQLYSIILENNKIRNNLKEFLTHKGIMSKVFFEPTHLTNFYRKNILKKKLILQNTEKISSCILTIPMFPGLTKQELDYICNSIKEFFENIKN